MSRQGAPRKRRRDNGRMQPPLARRTTTIQPFRVVDVMEAAWAAERAGRSIVHLEVGEPDFGTPAPVVEAATKAIADGRVRYTSSLGLPELREAISGYYADRFGIDVPTRRVVVTTGASGALLLALAAPGLLDGGTPFVINSFSKTFGMTGWRLGWMVCPDWALPAVEALAQNAFISPPAPAQYGGLAAFAPAVWATVEERRRAFAARRDVLVEGLRECGFGVPVTPHGAFYVYARSDGLDGDSMRLARRLLDEAG